MISKLSPNRASARSVMRRFAAPMLLLAGIVLSSCTTAYEQESAEFIAACNAAGLSVAKAEACKQASMRVDQSHLGHLRQQAWFDARSCRVIFEAPTLRTRDNMYRYCEQALERQVSMTDADRRAVQSAAYWQLQAEYKLHGPNAAVMISRQLIDAAAYGAPAGAPLIPKAYEANCYATGDPVACEMATRLGMTLDDQRVRAAYQVRRIERQQRLLEREEEQAAAAQLQAEQEEMVEQLSDQGMQSMMASLRSIGGNNPMRMTTGAPRSMAATASDTAGGNCSRDAHQAVCSRDIQECKSGIAQAACYRSAACLCEANLAAGGCGTDPGWLRQCVSRNRALAAQYR